MIKKRVFLNKNLIFLIFCDTITVGLGGECMSEYGVNSDVFRYGNLKSVGESMHSHHYHDNRFEIYYMVSGKCSYFVDDKVHEIVEGDIVLIPEGVIHKTNYNGQEHNRILVECTLSFIDNDVRRAVAGVGYHYRNAKASREILAILKQIEAEYKCNDEHTERALKSLMNLLFTVILRNPNSIVENKSKNAMVESVVSYVKEHYNTDITLTAAARMNFVSTEHLSRTFKKHTGFGFNEFLTLVRLQHAENLLKLRDRKSISEIAYSCGFNDSNYFSDKFKKAYGMSPLRYAKDFDKT